VANAELERKLALLNEDAFGKGWMLIVRAVHLGWQERLFSGPAIADAFAALLAAERHKDRSG
jgi:glycine cleavage system H lipoate-binding protein